ncbi:MAG: thrombospondin type 3 repeat-containing protein [Polyangiaceae bacterium]
MSTLAASLAMLGISRSAYADHAIPDSNGSGLDTHLFRPAVDSKGLFSTNGTDILGDRDISFGLVIDYGRTLLRVPSIPGEPSHLVSNSFQGTFQFNYGLLNQLVLGIDIPLNLMAGDARTAPGEAGWTLNQLDSQTLGFIALHAKWRITRVEHGLGLAIVGQVGVPLTDAPKNAGADSTVWFWPQAVIEKRFGSTGALRLAANAGVRVHGSSGTVLPLENGVYKDGSLFTYGGGASLRVLDPLDLVAETYASYLLSDSDAAVKPSNEVVGGIKLFVDRNSYLMLGAGPRYTNGFEAADFRAFLGFIFEPSIGDRDGDGIKDDLDQCPDDPEDRDGFKDEDGCPDPDNDNDGTLDVDDRCPNVPGPKETFGCPSTKDGDRDGDGIPDSRDKCPDQPEDKDGFQDQDGCPDPDNDKDGIPDVRDKCPNEPETFNGFEDEDGCPDKGMVMISDNDIKILKKVQFKTGSAEILPASNEILDAVATTLIHHPEFTLIEVAGHAD